jgi:DnaJ-class molecular chaperone
MVNNTDDFFELLCVSKNADEKEIKSGYKKAAKKYHPDNPKTGDEELFRKLCEAYEVLKDPQKRELYSRNDFYQKKAQDTAVKINYGYDSVKESTPKKPANKSKISSLRKCKKCFKEYPLNKSFFGHTTKKNFRHVCRDCMKESVKKHSEANPQLVKNRLKKRKDLENKSSKIKDYDKYNLKLELMQIQKNSCFYCKSTLLGNEMDLDHILPISRGGADVKKTLFYLVPFATKRNTIKI